MRHTREQHTEYMREWRKKNPQRNTDLNRKHMGSLERLEYQRQYYQKNKERLKEQKQIYYQSHRKYFKTKSNEAYRRNKKNKLILWQTKRRLVLSHYGNKCTCCGESMNEFLAIDHINNDGYLERKARTINIFDYLIKNNFPDTFQIHCHNCNLAKSFYGECPHKRC